MLEKIVNGDVIAVLLRAGYGFEKDKFNPETRVRIVIDHHRNGDDTYVYGRVLKVNHIDIELECIGGLSDNKKFTIYIPRTAIQECKAFKSTEFVKADSICSLVG